MATEPASVAVRASRAVLRILIGGIVFGSGLGKVINVTGWIGVLDTYRAVPPAWLDPIAYAVAGAELALGAWILSGWRLRTATLLAMAMNGFYAVWMMVSLQRGLDLPNCGCFGVFLGRPLTWRSPVEDVVAAALSWLLYRLAVERGELERGKQTGQEKSP